MLNLLAEGTYDHLNLEGELKAYHRWAEDKVKMPTRSGFIKWLARAEAPLKLGKKEQPPEINTYVEPPIGWRTHLLNFAPEYVGQPWSVVRVAYGRRVWLAVLAEQKAKAANPTAP